MNGYVKYFDKNNKYINLLVNDKETLKKYLEIWDKIKGLFKNDLIAKLVYLRANQCKMTNTLKQK